MDVNFSWFSSRICTRLSLCDLQVNKQEESGMNRVFAVCAAVFGSVRVWTYRTVQL